MPLPESSDAGQEPTPEAPEPGEEMVAATPRRPRKFSKLVLLTASKDSAKAASVEHHGVPHGVHCIMSLGVPGTAALTKALLQINPQRAIAAPQPEPEPERKRRKLDPDGKEDGSLAGSSAPRSSAGEEGPTARPMGPKGSPQP